MCLHNLKYIILLWLSPSFISSAYFLTHHQSSYYYGTQTKPIDIERVKLKALIRQIFNDSKQSAGARTIVA
ncbi:hypothetical protein, partial [Psychrobacter immobilis]|uniref:hypothetical protein n=1 Tax=Psychrobacter immobilis TaxID=498 RepID=UPI001D12DA90